MMWKLEPRIRFRASPAALYAYPLLEFAREIAQLRLIGRPLQRSRRSEAIRTVKERTAKRYFVSGMVQGVGYRFFAIRVAERLGVSGFVKNLRDGRVEVYGIGSSETLAALRRELERGPSGAMVDEVREEEAAFDPQFERGFSIEHEGW